MERQNKDLSLSMRFNEVFQSQRAQGCWLEVMGGGSLMWRKIVWDGCPWAPTSLQRADGVWGGSWGLSGSRGSSRGMLGHSLGLAEVTREGRRGCREGG